MPWPGNFTLEVLQNLKKNFRISLHQKVIFNLLGRYWLFIAPHAGYVYSGSVAAESFEQIDRDRQIDNIFLIGSSHRYAFDGASIYTLGNFRTPLGDVQVNLDLAKELCRKFSVFTTRVDAQMNEHSLEVQLPFLQYWLHQPFRIIPIVLGTQNVATCHEIAEALRPYFNQSNLFVISTDFSHYPAYTDARNADHKTAEAILTNKPDRLLKAIQTNEKSDIPGLATSLCGWTSVMTLLYITEEMPGIAYKLIDYRNSGDASVGDKSRVVGYCAMGVYPSASSSGQTEKNLTRFLMKTGLPCLNWHVKQLKIMCQQEKFRL